MDPITVATTVFACVAFVKDMRELAQKLAESVEKVSDNRKKLRALCNNSVKHLVELEEVTRAHEADLTSRQLQDALTELRDELERIYRRCSKRIGHRKRGLPLVWSHLKSWKAADELEADILIFESNIRACEMRFLTTSMVRFEQNARLQAHSFHAMNAEQHSSMNQLVQAFRQSTFQEPQEVPYAVVLRQNTTDSVVHRGIVARPSALIHEPASTSFSPEYVSGAARSALCRRAPAEHHRFCRSQRYCSKAVRPHYFERRREERADHSRGAHTADPSVQIKDAILEISCTLKMFRSAPISATDCAKNLHSLATILGDLAMYASALMVLARSVSLYRDMHRKQPKAFAPYLARSVRFVALYRLKLGQYSAAKVASSEATELYRQAYADTLDDGIAADLGISLNIYSLVLRHKGQMHRADVLSVAEEAVCIFRRLADAREEFMPELANMLIGQARHFGDGGDFDKALECVEEATNLCRTTVQQSHVPFAQHRLARALFNYAHHLWKAGRTPECLQANEEAVELFRGFFSARPNAWRVEFCDALNNQAWFSYTSGLYEDALRLSQEAIPILRGVATTAKEYAVFTNILDTLAAVLEAMGRLEDSLATVEQIVHTIYDCPAFLKRSEQLIKALRWAARLLRALDRFQEAQQREDEAALEVES
ncbi:hypothetical protein SCP_0413190 [Sparassis crispa]|uniref:Uncharacterized protein n=1 Tax=Sparassis crispa TaxID=139825 RepID=A0A401GLB0_9APHY|nr:hypothetical protein SCP_0413190 [Sparassis crispa]GBE82932.1 hypothetical protein SCP_0413190 [Sparassis crispa]